MVLSRNLVAMMLLASTGCTPVTALGTRDGALGATATEQVSGLVLDTSGVPVAGAVVRTFPIDSATDLATAPDSLVAHGAAGRRTLSATRTTVTAADGTFRLDLAPSSAVNLEVTSRDATTKAWRPGLTAASGNLGALLLKPPGSLRGRITLPGVPTVTNFEGVDVYVPGSAYAAKCDESGRYVLDGVAEGTFTLVAGRTGLGRARVAGLAVRSGEILSVPDLALLANPPRIKAIQPPIAAVGEWVTLTGEYFGASEGLAVAVTVAGLEATRVDRLSDNRLRFMVPRGITSGSLQVQVGGLASEATESLFFDTLGNDLELGDLTRTPGQPLALRTFGLLGNLLTATTVDLRWTFADTEVTVSSDSVRMARPGRYLARAQTGGIAATLSVLVLPEQPEVTTVAGANYSGHADGALREALFSDTYGMTTTESGRILAVDASNHCVRTVDLALGKVGTLAGIPKKPGFADGPGDQAMFWNPRGIAAGPGGVAYVADYYNFSIRRIAPDSSVTTLAGTNSVAGFADGPGPQARFAGPNAVARMADGSLLVTDKLNNALRRVTADGLVSTLVGDGMAGQRDGPLAYARLASPRDAVEARDGTIWIADGDGRRLRRLRDGKVQTVLELWRTLETPWLIGPNGTQVRDMKAISALEPGPGGSVLAVDDEQNRLAVIWPDGTLNSLAGGSRGESDGLGALARFFWPAAITTTREGDILVSDSGSGTIRRVRVPDVFWQMK